MAGDGSARPPKPVPPPRAAGASGSGGAEGPRHPQSLLSSRRWLSCVCGRHPVSLLGDRARLPRWEPSASSHVILNGCGCCRRPRRPGTGGKTQQLYIGADVARDWPDSHPPRRGARRIDNAPAAPKAFAATCAGEGAWIVFKASGGDDPRLRMTPEAGQLRFSRLSRREARDFARAMGGIGKTDRCDARMLCDLGFRLRPAPTAPLAASRRGPGVHRRNAAPRCRPDTPARPDRAPRHTSARVDGIAVPVIAAVPMGRDPIGRLAVMRPKRQTGHICRFCRPHPGVAATSPGTDRSAKPQHRSGDALLRQATGEGRQDRPVHRRPTRDPSRPRKSHLPARHPMVWTARPVARTSRAHGARGTRGHPRLTWRRPADDAPDTFLMTAGLAARLSRLTETPLRPTTFPENLVEPRGVEPLTS